DMTETRDITQFRRGIGIVSQVPPSGFAEPPDRLSLELNIDDKPLKDIIGNLYYPDSPYEFSVMPADVLGQVYEQFLGKVIRLTAGHQAKVEEKPEVRKAGGVYYTPTYIVDYIVKNTVGKLLEGKTPKEAEDLRILDPACGSGSFLLGAYQYLLDWHLDYYQKSVTLSERSESKGLSGRRAASSIHQDAKGNWRLTTAERKRILLNSIYGVDIDSQAVEVTKLSLLLKVLEGENQETLGSQLKLYHERALPDLGSNIKCGNSLIGPDFYQNQQSSLFDDEEKYRINVFDWQAGFPDIMKRGGFDAVIGNPPYIFARSEGFKEHEKGYYQRYKHSTYQLHSFTLFVEKGHELLKKDGHLGFIIPNNWLTIGSMKPFRDFVVRSTGKLTVVNCLCKVFRGASVDTSLLLFQRRTPTLVKLAEMPEPGQVTEVASARPDDLTASPIINMRLQASDGTQTLMTRIEACSRPLADFAVVKAGLKAYETGKGTPPQTDAMKHERVCHATARRSREYRKYLDGRDVMRYRTGWSGEYLKYGPNLAAPRNPSLFEGTRILVRQIPSRPPYAINGAIVCGEELNDINSMIAKPSAAYDAKFLLGVLNSRLLTFWFVLKYDKFQRAIFPQFKVNELATFPVAKLDMTGKADKAKYDKMVELVETMLKLHRDLPKAKTPHETEALQRQIAATDGQIDTLVYELYGLTEDEIRAVEWVR
ncbi:MAG: N-6 DNA methylase, partial [candidate division WOR-3 bacterium]|nr:N-6 DNA methylase [candidate division WOR-3 bacterium]